MSCANGFGRTPLVKVPNMPNQCTILVDWAYAFDYLARLEVKQQMLGGHELIIHAFSDHLAMQLGKRFKTIHHSAAYQALFAANLATWPAVERARYGQISAKEVDDLNMERQKAKAVLQMTFWTDALTEVKS